MGRDLLATATARVERLSKHLNDAERQFEEDEDEFLLAYSAMVGERVQLVGDELESALAALADALQESVKATERFLTKFKALTQ